MTGFLFSEPLAHIHFYLFLWGVNITFFPMHFLGLAGMPRRIPAYPDAFQLWNLISSSGMVVTTASLLAFFVVIYDSFSIQPNVWEPTERITFLNSKSWFSLPEYRIKKVYYPKALILLHTLQKYPKLPYKNLGWFHIDEPGELVKVKKTRVKQKPSRWPRINNSTYFLVVTSDTYIVLQYTF